MTTTTTGIDIDPLLFRGTLLNQNGNPIRNAKIQLWQTDLDGNYLHPHPGAAVNPPSSEHASTVSDFQYFGTDGTDYNGNFEFLTHRPGIYGARPYSHFHFMVWLRQGPVDVDVAAAGGDDNGVEGELAAAVSLPDLVTQFYFADENPPFPEVLHLDVAEVDDDDAGAYAYGSYVNGTIVVVDANNNSGSGGSTTELLPSSPRQPKGPFYPEIDFFSADNDLTTTSAIKNDATIMQSADPAVSPTEGPIISTGAPTAAVISTGAPTAAVVEAPVYDGTAITGAPLPAAVVSTGYPTASVMSSSNSPSLDPTQILDNDALQTTTLSPTLQPVQMNWELTSPSSAAGGCNLGGMIGVWFVASVFAALRNFM